MSAPLVRTEEPGVYKRGGAYIAVWYDASGTQRSMTLPSFEEAKGTRDRERRRRGQGNLQERTDLSGTVTWYCRIHVNGKQKRHRLGVKRLPDGTIVMTEAEAEERLRDFMRATSPVEREFRNLVTALIELRTASPPTAQAAVETALRRVHWIESELRKQTMEKESA